MSNDELLDIEAVCRFFGGTKPLHPATIYRGLGKRYPLPIKVGPNANRWRHSECEAALARLAEASSLPARQPARQAAPAAEVAEVA